MIDIGAWNGSRTYFVCDECGICEQLEYRMQVAYEFGEDLQFDHCSCDKINAEFFAGGYCEDAFIKEPFRMNSGSRKTGRAYRRKMRRKNIQKYRDRDNYGWNEWKPGPHIHRHLDDEGEFAIDPYVEYPRSSANKVFFKRVSNKKVRQSKYIFQKGNGHRRLFDYWWTIC